MAFICNVNGTIEHNQLNQQVLKHARRNKKIYHVTFFDLKDAFGSISHDLTHYCLKRYNIPTEIQIYIRKPL